MQERQNSDGSLSGLRERDDAEMYRLGGYMAPAGVVTTTGYTVVDYPGGINIQANINGASANTAGGLFQWQNNLGYDVIVVAHVLDITTPSAGACTVSFGQASTGSVTASTNMINNQSAAATATVNGGALSVKVPSNQWIVGSTGGGSASGLVARVTIFMMNSNPTAGGI